MSESTGYLRWREEHMTENGFNADSATVQRAANVNPDECIKIKFFPGTETVTLDAFLAGLTYGVWFTPAEATEHDEEAHWQGLRRWHPEFGAHIITAAERGVELLKTGHRHDAEKIGEAIDNVAISMPCRAYVREFIAVSEVIADVEETHQLLENHAKTINEFSLTRLA